MKKAFPLACLLIFTILLACLVMIRHADPSLVCLSSSDNTKKYTYKTQTNTAVQLGKLNINTATAKELTLLPGIGDVLAQRIITYRQENGPFQDIDDLIQVKGIGKTRLNAIREYITIGD